MSRFGKKQEDQLAYKCEKLEKRCAMLLQHVENIEKSNRMYHLITSAMLKQIGGTINIVDEQEPTHLSINISRDEDMKTTTISIKEELVVEEEITDDRQECGTMQTAD
jgi:hypothetical protein